MPDIQQIRVWAPLAERVDALVGSPHETEPPTRRSLTPTGDGHWTIDLTVGTDYLLSVDGGEPRPDPRSARQPYGLDGPSRVFDASHHTWHDEDWVGREVLGGVMYEVHVGTFTEAGTLDAAIDRLDHLVELGVDTIELMPLAPFPGERGWGYDGVSLFAVNEHYGGPEALQRFVDAAHGRGLAVCLDVVYNHFGPAGNYTQVFAPYLTEKHHTPWGAAINLDDAYNEGVRAFIIDNALRWITDFHIDALRLDAVHALIDESARHILAELSDTVSAHNAHGKVRAELIAESDLNQPTMLLPTAEGGMGMDGQWADDVHHALHAWLTGETFGYYVDFGSPETLAKAFTDVFVHDGSFSTFRGADWGAPLPAGIERRRFVTFTQNHDQVGNRGLGDRPDHDLHPGQVAAGAALTLLSPFTPMLFQGQEWSTARPFMFFTDHEPELGRLVTEGRTREFAQHGWDVIYGDDATIPDPQDAATFEASRLDWSEPAREHHAGMLDWYRRLIALRREYLGGVNEVSTDFGEGWFQLRHGRLVVTAAVHSPASVPLSGEVVASYGTLTHKGGTLDLEQYAVAVVLD